MFVSTRENKVDFENKLAEAVLEESVRNSYIKRILADLATVFCKEILSPIEKEISHVGEFKQLSIPVQKAISVLALNHSDEDRQYNGLLREKFKTTDSITANIENIRLLIMKVFDVLKNIENISSIDQMMLAMKIFCDVSLCYLEMAQVSPSKKILEIYNMLWPSPEEFAARYLFTEAGMKPHRALTLGISRTAAEIIPVDEDKENIGLKAGKSFFHDVNTEVRLKLLAAEYDKLCQVEEKISAPLETFFKKVNTMFGSRLVAEFKKYPGHATTSLNFSQLAKQYEASFLKLARTMDVPLIASVSGSIARVLITLQYFDGFNTDSQFDPDKAQVLANCLMGFLIRAGHHSHVEAAESYNRLLDYILLDDRRMPHGFFAKKQQAIHEGKPLESLVEYYYQVGDAVSFINKNYRERFSSFSLSSKGL